jgi:hypothetical protein
MPKTFTLNIYEFQKLTACADPTAGLCLYTGPRPRDRVMCLPRAVTITGRVPYGARYVSLWDAHHVAPCSVAP